MRDDDRERRALAHDDVVFVCESPADRHRHAERLEKPFGER